MKKYKLTEEHKKELKPWADKWIDIILSCDQMTDEDKKICREAVHGLYNDANSSDIHDDKIIFVSSPIQAAFIAAIANFVWWCNDHNQCPFSQKIIEKATRDATRDATEVATWTAALAATRDATEAATRAATSAATAVATRAATSAATAVATWDATRDATEAATWAATEAATLDATEAAIWDATEAATWAATEAATRAAIQAATWAATRAASKDATLHATEAATKAATLDATEDATWAATRDATRAATEAATEAATAVATAVAIWDATEAATWAATEAATRAASRDATLHATWAATRDAIRDAIEAATRDDAAVATWAATEAATRAAIQAATWAATRAASKDATLHATEAATKAATLDATEDATWAATRDATRAATEAATEAATAVATAVATWDAARDATAVATEVATWDAARDATRDAAEFATLDASRDTIDGSIDLPTQQINANLNNYYVYPLFYKFLPLAFNSNLKVFLENINYLWNGGNMWAPSVSLYTFFRYIAKLDIDYSKFDHYEKLAIHCGPRFMHSKFCIISDRPLFIKKDDQNMPHCEDGPFIKWRDGSALYAVHGVNLPAWIIETPEKITIEKIDKEDNAEIRRVMINKIGIDNYVKKSNFKEVHADNFGILFMKEFDDGSILKVVKVKNSTPEPDGTYKYYFLRVSKSVQTAHEAVASTFGMTADEYQPTIET